MKPRTSIAGLLALGMLAFAPSHASTPLYPVPADAKDESAKALLPDPKPLPPTKVPVEIDMLVVIDSRFPTHLFGSPEAWAQQQVANTNEAFANSLINAHLNLVGTRVVYNVPNIPVGLEWRALANPSDNVLDEVHIYREELGADLVVMWSEQWRENGANLDGGTCGVAGFDAGTQSPGEAFAIVQRHDAATGLCSRKDFLHEVGHLLAADHPHGVIGSPGGPGPYSAPTARARKVTTCGGDSGGEGCIWTIMTSTSGDPPLGTCRNPQGASVPCNVLERHYSNPDVFFGKYPTGTASENNAAAINGAVLNASMLRSRPAGGIIRPKTGIWFSPSRNKEGHGLMLSAVPGDPAERFVAVWFTYRPGGKPVWYISDPEPMRGSVWTAKLMETTGNPGVSVPGCTDPGAVSHPDRCHVGQITLSFTGAQQATLYWQLPGQPDAFGPRWIGGHVGEPVVHQWGGGPMEGLYADLSDLGWGYQFSQDSIQTQRFVSALYYYDESQRPTWVLGTHAGTTNLTQQTLFTMGYNESPTQCPGCAAGPGCRPGTSGCPIGSSDASPNSTCGAGTIGYQLATFGTCPGYTLIGNFQVGPNQACPSAKRWVPPNTGAIRTTCQLSTR